MDNTNNDQTTNYTLKYRRFHPGARCSYGIDGNTGIVVFALNLFEGGDVAGFVPPAEIVLSVPMVSVKADNREAKIQEQAARAADRAEKAQAKAETIQARITERAEKLKSEYEVARDRAARVAAATQG